MREGPGAGPEWSSLWHCCPVVPAAFSKGLLWGEGGAGLPPSHLACGRASRRR